MLQLQNIYLILMIIMFYLFISRGLQEKNDNRYAACYEAAKKVILKYKELQKVEELHKASPLTVSYYYDRAQDAGLVGKCIFITLSIDQEPRDITDKGCQTIPRTWFFGRRVADTYAIDNLSSSLSTTLCAPTGNVAELTRIDFLHIKCEICTYYRSQNHF